MASHLIQASDAQLAIIRKALKGEPLTPEERAEADIMADMVDSTVAEPDPKVLHGWTL